MVIFKVILYLIGSIKAFLFNFLYCLFAFIGNYVLTNGEDEASLSHGIFDTYTGTNLRYSQVAPLDMFKEKNTGCNLPAQFDLYATKGNEYHFQFMAKGGGSANYVRAMYLKE